MPNLTQLKILVYFILSLDIIYIERKTKSINWFLLEVLMIQESCNLIGQDHIRIIYSTVAYNTE